MRFSLLRVTLPAAGMVMWLFLTALQGIGTG